MTTITPRSFATRRIVHSLEAYQSIANLIKKYGCAVSKVSDGVTGEAGFYTILYFDIPIEAHEAFMIEERQEVLSK